MFKVAGLLATATVLLSALTSASPAPKPAEPQVTNLYVTSYLPDSSMQPSRFFLCVS